jgi:flagellar hook assembly protein FlgD
MLGQKVKVLVDQPQPAGSYKVQWDGRNQQGQGVSSGVYIYELKTEETNITKKLVLAR